MGRKKPSKKRQSETVFSLDGQLMAYPGSMLELNGDLDADQWRELVTETCCYSVFVKCLKDVAFPMLDERWTTEDEFCLHQLELSSSRMRNIDPLLVASLKLGELKDTYTTKMREGADSVNAMIKEFRAAAAGGESEEPPEITVSGL